MCYNINMWWFSYTIIIQNIPYGDKYIPTLLKMDINFPLEG